MSHSTPSEVLGFPDVVMPGAARSGTSFLAARLTEHACIDNGAIKEPNYFSRHLDRGPEWYDAMFKPRSAEVLRLDASMSYTVPEFPDALSAVAAAAPDAKVIYAVRDPLERAVSHYRLLKDYLVREDSATFSTAIEENEVYLGTGDYARWLGEIVELWGRDRLLIVPFPITTHGSAATDATFEFLGLDPLPLADDVGRQHRNEVVEFRHAWVRRLRRVINQSSVVYPRVREVVGADRMRRLRSWSTKAPDDELTTPQALASCTAAQRAEIADLRDRSRAAVTDALKQQDARLGLEWTEAWEGSFGDPLAGFAG